MVVSRRTHHGRLGPHHPSRRKAGRYRRDDAGHDYMALSDQEISDIIAYATNMPAVNDVQPETTLVL